MPEKDLYVVEFKFNRGDVESHRVSIDNLKRRAEAEFPEVGGMRYLRCTVFDDYPESVTIYHLEYEYERSPR